MTGTLASLVEHVRQARPSGGMITKIVGIDGPGGAGKSTLASRLAESLGPSTDVVHTDDFASADEPIEWWPRLLTQVLEPLGQNDAARYQRYDWDERSLAEWHTLQPGGTVILEGVSATRDAFRRYLACSIWVDTPRDERLRRGLARDGEGSRDQWAIWMADEDQHFDAERSRERADIIVPGDSPLADPG